MIKIWKYLSILTTHKYIIGNIQTTALIENRCLMRRYIISNNKNKFNKSYTTILFLILSLCFILPSVTSIEMEFDISPQEIFEEEYFEVSIYEKNEVKYLDEVSIIFNSNTYEIESGEDTISIKAPIVYSDQEYLISASKTGYDELEKTITIYNKPPLIVKPEKYTVEPNERFAVLVTDEQGNPVLDVTVTIQSSSDSCKTGEDGYAWLTAPEDREKITIIATKERYETENTAMMVNNKPQTLEIDNTMILVIIAILFLISAIIYVNLRNRKDVNNRVKEITKEKKIEKYSGSHGAILNSNITDKENTKNNIKKGPKIEEIRISRPKKEKEIFSVNSDTNKENKAMPVTNQNKDNDDWFQGKDDVRYEIDKLTGKVDEEGLDKWFEGVDDLREKIDKKVKKKDKDLEDN